ncbi:non-ribosomal peptide synthetase [Clostridium sp. BNL1100]|uniref:non-ribosomal peptide synthetase n=1 Tax=Clostridium sp. BNL1100 TaxID=755731 RepID=UPI00024A7944|nr:non-ribosomal peptide synthetase [Clostridium sp. BNL1100]AEY66121.1 amino acid adenylation enzyme/thioester reductase family protein [Clostridium sp. BNL1100]
MDEKNKERAYFSLTEPQKSIWLTQQLSDSMNHSVTVDVSFDGKQDKFAASKAISLLYKYNQVLRTEVTEADGVPMQFFRDYDPNIMYGSVREFSSAVAYSAFAAGYAEQRMDETLCEITAFSYDSKYGFLIKGSHMLIDGVSAIVLLARVKKYYDAVATHKEIDESEYRYQEFIEQEAKYYDGSLQFLKDREFWQDKLSVITEPTRIARCAGHSLASKRFSYPLASDFEERLKGYCKRASVMEFAVLMSCFARCVSEHVRSKPTSILCAVMRSRKGAVEEASPGMYVNTIPVVFDDAFERDSEDTAEKTIKTITKDFIKAAKHFRYSWNYILADYYQIQGQNQAPSDVTFSYQNFGSFDMSQFVSEAFSHTWYSTGTQVDSLAFHARREPRGSLQFVFDYRVEVFSEEDISNFCGHLITMLDSLFANPDARIAELEMISDAERETILGAFNDTYAAYPRYKTIVDLFEEQVVRTPDNVALKFGDKIMTYAELNRKANELAMRLRRLGVHTDDRVAILAERGMEMIVGIYGILKSGGAYVPIDPALPMDRIKFMLEDSNAKALVNAVKSLSLKTDVAKVEMTSHCLFDDDEPNPKRDPNGIMYCLYTSGTTGRPKGVMFRDMSVVNFLLWMQETYPLDETDVILQKTNYGFDVSVSELFWWGLVGAKMVILPNGLEREPKELARFIAKERITAVNFVPSMLSAFVAEIKEKELRLGLGSLKYIFAAGEVLSPDLVKQVLNPVDGISPAALLSNQYGPTEANVVTYYNCDKGEKTIPIGCPIHNTQIYIINGGKLCGIGVPGELYIAGDGLARGYLNRPELTAEKFIENPYGEGRIYRSGDLARWLPDGNIEYLGRIDEQVKIRGYRIELGEIESLIRKQPGVADATVIVRERNGDKSLCAYLVAEHKAQPQELDMSAIRDVLRSELPEYMIPAFMTQLEALPLNRNGKLDKHALPEPDALAGRKYVAPRNEMEQAIISVYEEILGVSPIGIDDSFFELGGHSLRATVAVNDLEKRTGIRLPLKAVFASPTPRELAAELQVLETGAYNPIPKAEKRDYYPMSPAQKRLFLIDQMGGAGLAYNMPAAVEVTGELHLADIQKTLEAFTRHHEALRTSFTVIEGEAVQIIGDEGAAAVEYEEIDEYSEEELDKFTRPFDLGQAPLLRLKILNVIGENRHILLFDMHHIISDGMTMNIIIKEFSKLAGGEEPVQPEVQYKDYSEWLRGRDLSAQREFWKDVFKDEAPVLDLPTDYTRPKTQSFRGGHVSILLNQALKNGIEKINQASGTTDFMTFLSVFMVMLHKYSRQEDVVVGTPISGRVHRDTQSMVGMFVNTLAMRGYPTGEKTFSEFLSEIKEHALGAYENQEYPFEEFLEDVEVRRDLARNPLFDVMFVLQNNEKAELQMGDARFRPLETEPKTAKFDLTLQVSELNGGYEVLLEYCRELFAEESVRMMLLHFETLLDSILENPDARIAELEMISDGERETILGAFNDTRANYPQDATVVDLFEEQVAKTPHNIALTFGNETMTYAELNGKANSLAHRLRELGVKPDDRVVLLAERSVEMIVGILGIIKAGGAYVPIDPAYPEERIRFVIEDTAPKAVLAYGVSVPGEVCVPVLYLSDPDAYGMQSENLSKVNGPRDLVYIIYTSGTTGKPKGVMIEHKGVVNLKKRLQRNNPCEADTILQFASLSFDAATYEIASSLLFGGSLCLISNDTILDTKLFEEYAESHHVTMALLPPHYFTQVNLKLRRIITGGSAASVETVIRARRLGSAYTNEYGPTEATVTASCWEYEAGTPIPNAIPIGKPVENTQIYIINGGKLCGIGVPGELYIAGDGLARGYLNRPELTAEKFIENPYGEGRIYRSGDLARWLPDGNIEYLGRIDEQVKIRGYRIELDEIESLIRKQPGVADVTVIVRERNGDKSLCAYLVAEHKAQPQELDMSAIRDVLRSELPEYMIPAFMTQLEALPLNRNGKLDKHALPEPDALAGRKYVAPRNEMEQAIISVYEEILGVSPIGIDDSFFELGGHSLRATVAVNDLEKRTGIRLPLKAVFVSPTPRELAAELQVLETGAYNPIPKAEKRDYYPMSPAQKRLFLIDQMGGAGLAYNMPAAVEVTGELHLADIQKTLEALIRHHEALRTSFTVIEGEAVQIIRDEVAAAVEYEEIDEYSEEELDKFTRPFDLGQAPLLRLKILNVIGENRHILLFDMHHIISDGMTMNIIIKEFSKLAGGEEPVQPEVQYKDYSEWLRGRDLSAQREFWKDVFKDEAPVLDLPTDYPRPKTQSFRGGHVSILLNQALKNGIEKINQASGTTDFMTFLSVFMVMLYKYSRQEDVVVGTPISGRVHRDTQSMLGMFVNTLAMRGYPTGEKTFSEFLSEIKEHALGAYENQEYPFEELLEDVEVRRDLSRNPLFDVMFVLQNNEKAELQMGDARFRPLETEPKTAKFDLLLQVSELNGGYEVLLEYCRDLFTEESARTMLLHFEALLDSILENPDARIAELEMISDVERETILGDFNERINDRTQIYIIDSGKLCGIGVAGELCIAGAALDCGQLNNTEISKNKFGKNPYGEGRLYHSGELARWQIGGNLEYIGHTSAHDNSDSNIKSLIESEARKTYPYSGYVNYLQSRNTADSLAYWRSLLSDYEGDYYIKSVSDVDSNEAYSGVVSRKIEQGLLDQLEETSKNLNISIGTIFESAFGLLLQKYVGSSDVLFGKLLLGKNEEFINSESRFNNSLYPIPVRFRAESKMSLVELLRDVARQSSESLRNRHYTMASIQEMTAQNGNIMRVLFVLKDCLRDEEFIQGRDLESKSIGDQTSNELTFIVKIGGNNTLEVFFHTKKYCKMDGELLLSRFHHILTQMADSTAIECEDIMLGITEQENNDVFIPYNNTDICFQNGTLHGLFIEQVMKTPMNVAVIYNDQQITYSLLYQKACRVANFILASGVKPGAKIAVMGERKIETIVNIFGILFSGCSYVPLSPDYPEERNHYIITNSDCKMTLIANTWEDAAHYSDKIYQVRGGADELAYVIYTSGSTGTPKGVAIRHGAVVNTIIAINRKFQIDAKDRIIGLSSFAFDLSVYDIFGALSTGATLVMVGDQRNVNEIQGILAKQKITFWNSVPAIMDIFNESVDQNFVNMSLRNVLLSGDWIPLHLTGAIRNKFPNASVTSLGGATESSIWSIYFPIHEVKDVWRSIPYGKPLANQKMYVLDKKLHMCPVGISGQICIGGKGVAEGYVNDSVKTNRVFVNHDEYGKIYLTGDYGRMRSDGNIEFLGRVDDQIKIRGFRIELGEIESVIRKQPGVLDAVVIVREIDGDKSICAYLVPKQGIEPQELDVFTVREALREKLPEYMIPTFIIKLKALPLNKNGKLDKRALPKPDGIRRTYIAPRTDVECAITQVFEEILGLTSIGIDDSFFELGGDSMKAVRTVSKLREKGYEFTVIDIMQKQTARLIGTVNENDRKINMIDFMSITTDESEKDKTGNMKIDIIDAIENYGNNFLRSNSHNDCNTLYVNQYFLKEIKNIMIDVNEIHYDADGTASILRTIISHQGAMRVKFNEVTERFEEYEYCDDWIIPILDTEKYNVEMNSFIDVFQQVARELNFLSDNRLLSRILILKTGVDRCAILHAVHHSIWDGVSKDLLRAMITEELRIGQLVKNSQSYIQYCNDIENTKKNYVFNKEEILAFEECVKLVFTTYKSIKRLAPDSLTSIRVKLDNTKSKEFSVNPINTAMKFFSNLLYDDTTEESLIVPFTILRHNRNHRNTEMLGLTLDANFTLFDIRKKTKIECMLDKYFDPEVIPFSEKISLFQEKFGFSGMDFMIPNINYQGLFQVAGGLDRENMDEMQIKIETTNFNTGRSTMGMAFYMQDNILMAQIVGIRVDKNIVERALNNIDPTTD